jgi:predicted RNA-binding Zn-ribbon protein involved in translation (DUF1610 family)
MAQITGRVIDVELEKIKRAGYPVVNHGVLRRSVANITAWTEKGVMDLLSPPLCSSCGTLMLGVDGDIYRCPACDALFISSCSESGAVKALRHVLDLAEMARIPAHHAVDQYTQSLRADEGQAIRKIRRLLKGVS